MDFHRDDLQHLIRSYFRRSIRYSSLKHITASFSFVFVLLRLYFWRRWSQFHYNVIYCNYQTNLSNTFLVVFFGSWNVFLNYLWTMCGDMAFLHLPINGCRIKDLLNSSVCFNSFNSHSLVRIWKCVFYVSLHFNICRCTYYLGTTLNFFLPTQILGRKFHHLLFFLFLSRFYNFTFTHFRVFACTSIVKDINRLKYIHFKNITASFSFQFFLLMCFYKDFIRLRRSLPYIFFRSTETIVYYFITFLKTAFFNSWNVLLNCLWTMCGYGMFALTSAAGFTRTLTSMFFCFLTIVFM